MFLFLVVSQFSALLRFWHFAPSNSRTETLHSATGMIPKLSDRKTIEVSAQLGFAQKLRLQQVSASTVTR